jgi:phosphatidate phosphatase APP1
VWHAIELELLDPLPNDQRGPVMASGAVLVPPPTARFGVISDIDDTVLKSDATHALRMARNVFLGNAHTRMPFPGVAALFRALYRGASGAEMNPVFFLSSSPWNLYDLFIQFFRLQEIPGDPVLFLRDWGITHEEILPLNHRRHKTGVIRRMLDFYPDLPFILVGDSGQADPEVYTEMVAAYPDRILAVYIRNVVRDLVRPDAVRELATQVVNAGSTLVLADDSLAIARHAVEIGLIDAAALPSIGEEKRKDEAPPTPLEKILGEETPEEGVTVEIDSDDAPEAIEDGMIEDTMKEQGKETTKQPPTVVVQDQQAQKRARQKIEKNAAQRKEEN